MPKLKKETPVVEPPVAPETITSYKGFDQNWKCRGYQYEFGKTFEHKGNVSPCNSGFHACEYPLDVFRYYAPAESRFAVVQQSGTIARHNEDSKVASSSLTLSVEIDIPGLIEAAIAYTMAQVKPADGATNTTDRGAASNSGESGVASNSGESGAASNSGDRGVASNSGDSGAASNSGFSGVASNSGFSGAASNSGDSGVAADFNGCYTRVKSCDGGAVFLINRGSNGAIQHVFASKVGENGIKPDVWYALGDDGKPMEIAA